MSFAIIDDTGVRRSYKVNMDKQNGELLRLTLKERDAGAVVLWVSGQLRLEASLFRKFNTSRLNTFFISKEK
jgi:hypothetical protein